MQVVNLKLILFIVILFIYFFLKRGALTIYLVELLVVYRFQL